MKTVFCLAAIVASASAFAPTSKPHKTHCESQHRKVRGILPTRLSVEGSEQTIVCGDPLHTDWFDYILYGAQ